MFFSIKSDSICAPVLICSTLTSLTCSEVSDPCWSKISSKDRACALPKAAPGNGAAATTAFTPGDGTTVLAVELIGCPNGLSPALALLCALGSDGGSEV